MNNRKQLLLLARSLKPLSIQKYAESRGWTKVDGVRGRLWLFRHPEDTLRQLMIPKDTEIDGFGDAIVEVAERIAQIEKRTIIEVLTDLQWPDADILRFRIKSKETEGGHLPLGDDVNFREGAKRALLAAACSVVHPATHHPRMSRSEAESFVASCRAGQTEIGSYVVKLVCPLYETEQTQLLHDEPFARSVTTYIMKTITQLVDGIENGRLDEYLEQNRSDPWLSSNFCDALLKMKGDRDRGQVDLVASWAAEPSLKPPIDVSEKVSIKHEYFPIIERTSQQLRPSLKERKEEFLVGTVEALFGQVGDHGKRSGEVLFSLLLPESEQLRARAVLDETQYEIAVQAHKKGMSYIQFRGVVTRGPRLGRIESVTDLRPISDDYKDV